jgi:hypothetical protein
LDDGYFSIKLYKIPKRGMEGGTEGGRDGGRERERELKNNDFKCWYKIVKQQFIAFLPNSNYFCRKIEALWT